MLIGLTGGIATGKSTVSSIIRKSPAPGIPVIDADLVAREVVEPGQPAYRKIVAHFGREVLQDPESESSPLDRAKLGSLIFADAGQRRSLNGITHPYILRTIWWRIFVNFLRGSRLVVLDAPLLVETGLHRFMAYNIIVSCPRDIQIKRLRARNPELSEEDCRNRVDSQMSIEEKLKVPNALIIDNSGSLEETENQVRSIIAELRKRWITFVSVRLAILVGTISLMIAAIKAVGYLK